MTKLIIIYATALVLITGGFFAYLHYSNNPHDEQLEELKDRLEIITMEKGKYVSPRQQRAVTGQ